MAEEWPPVAESWVLHGVQRGTPGTRRVERYARRYVDPPCVEDPRKRRRVPIRRGRPTCEGRGNGGRAGTRLPIPGKGRRATRKSSGRPGEVDNVPVLHGPVGKEDIQRAIRVLVHEGKRNRNVGG